MNKKLLALIAGFAVSAGFVFAEEMKMDGSPDPAVNIQPIVADNMDAGNAVNEENMMNEENVMNEEGVNAEAPVVPAEAAPSKY